MKWSHWFLYIVTLPFDFLVAWPAVLLIRLFWGQNLRWEKPPSYDEVKGGGGGWCLTCDFKPGSRPVLEGGWYWNKSRGRSWGGTSLCHGIFYGPNGRWDDGWSGTQAHEHIHVEQAEVSLLRSFIVGGVAAMVVALLGHPWAAFGLGLGIWTTGYLMMAVAGWFTAFLRGEEAYHGSTHEESARGQTTALRRR